MEFAAVAVSVKLRSPLFFNDLMRKSIRIAHEKGRFNVS
jgi:hypothetical protein